MERSVCGPLLCKTPACSAQSQAYMPGEEWVPLCASLHDVSCVSRYVATSMISLMPKGKRQYNVMIGTRAQRVLYARPGCMKHAAKCMARMIDAILGCGAAAPNKLIWGRSLCVLGIEFCLSEQGFQCRPAQGKVKAWRQCIK